MRISDWSSDVCSSDLRRRPRIAVDQPYRDHDDEEAGRLRDRLVDDRDPAPGGAIGIAQFAAEPAQGIERGDDGGGDARRDQDLEPVRLNPVYRIAHEFMSARADKIGRAHV